ncbi:MAG: hypothetical protein ACJ74U_06175 [Jatrophihabitantaceae bacterium]
MSDSVLDILGIKSGEEVVLLGRPDENTRREPSRRAASRVRVRALVDRGTESKPHDGGANIEPAIGKDTLPQISLDLLRRQALNVLPGEPVMLRPAYGALLAQEFAIAMNALALGIAGGIVANNPLITLIGAFLFLSILSVAFLRRFR